MLSQCVAGEKIREGSVLTIAMVTNEEIGAFECFSRNIGGSDNRTVQLLFAGMYHYLYRLILYYPISCTIY